MIYRIVGVVCLLLAWPFSSWVFWSLGAKHEIDKLKGENQFLKELLSTYVKKGK